MANGQNVQDAVKRRLADIDKRRRSGKAMTGREFLGDPYAKAALSRGLAEDRKRLTSRR